MNQISVSVFSKTGRKGFHFIWKDPQTGKRRTKASGETKKRDALRAAIAFEDELNRKASPDSITWSDFVQEYDRQHLMNASKGTSYQAYCAFRVFEMAVTVSRLEEVPGVANEFRVWLLSSDLAPATQVGYMKHFRAAMNWAFDRGLMAERVKLKLPASPETEMRGRPLSGAEYQAMLMSAREVYGETLEDFISGLWLSGLRRGEAMILSWDRDSPFSIDQAGEYWRFRIRNGAQKSKRAQLAPMSPEFITFLEKRKVREGLVFNPLGHRGARLKPIAVGKAVSAIGDAAGVITDHANDRHATCHDFRRSFGDRWSRKVMPPDLKELMRHRSIDTTMKYYVGRNVDDISARLHQIESATNESEIVA